MHTLWRLSAWLSSSATEATSVRDAPDTLAIEHHMQFTELADESDKRRVMLFRQCMRYPSPYKSELLRCLQTIAPTPEMVTEAGYCVTDLMDLQLGWPELQLIGFTKEDLYEMGLTYEMTLPESIYAPMLSMDTPQCSLREQPDAPCGPQRRQRHESGRVAEEHDEGDYYL